jgi:hypothetical protein
MEFKFTPEIADINTVPEQFRGFYAQAGDKHKLRLDDPVVKVSVETITGMTTALGAARADVKAAKAKAVDLTSLAEYGDSPEKILESVKAKLEEAALQGDGKAKQQLEGIKKALQEAHAKELTGRDTRITALQAQLYTNLVDANATTAIAELKGVPELILPFLRQNVKVEEKDGKLEVRVVDAAGETRYGAQGSPMTIKELVSEMKGQQKYGRLFESEAPNGGGTPPGQRRNNAVLQQTDRDKMSPTQKIQAGLRKGQASRPGVTA